MSEEKKGGGKRRERKEYETQEEGIKKKIISFYISHHAIRQNYYNYRSYHLKRSAFHAPKIKTSFA